MKKKGNDRDGKERKEKEKKGKESLPRGLFGRIFVIAATRIIIHQS